MEELIRSLERYFRVALPWLGLAFLFLAAASPWFLSHRKRRILGRGFAVVGWLGLMAVWLHLQFPGFEVSLIGKIKS